MRITSGKVVIRKDDGNLIGISIGGGAPLCPCLYVVQVKYRNQYWGVAPFCPYLFEVQVRYGVVPLFLCPFLLMQGTLVPKLTLGPFLTLSVRYEHKLKD